MKVTVYEDGDMAGQESYELTPVEAARLFAETRAVLFGAQPLELVVEPADAEAEALPGWQRDEDGRFMLFKLTPTTTWKCEPVDSFRSQS